MGPVQDIYTLLVYCIVLIHPLFHSSIQGFVCPNVHRHIQSVQHECCVSKILSPASVIFSLKCDLLSAIFSFLDRQKDIKLIKIFFELMES